VSEAGAHARDPLHHAEHNAITDQAAQLLHEWEELTNSGEYMAGREWEFRALAMLREVARG
jgi:hypothetical protein